MITRHESQVPALGTRDKRGPHDGPELAEASQEPLCRAAQEGMEQTFTGRSLLDELSLGRRLRFFLCK